MRTASARPRVVRSGRVYGRTSVLDPHGLEPHGIEPHGIDPHGIDPHGIDPHGIDPHGIEPHGIEPHGIEPHGIEPHGIEPATNILLAYQNLNKNHSYSIHQRHNFNQLGANGRDDKLRPLWHRGVGMAEGVFYLANWRSGHCRKLLR